MVSPQPSVSPSNPPLSYADRAKKAQNSGKKISPALQRTPSQTSPTAAASASSSALNSTADRPTAVAAAYEAQSLLPVSGEVASATPTASSAQSASGLPLPPNGKDDGDANPSGTDVAASSEQEAPAMSKRASVPATNVWNVRIEQFAQARARSSGSAQTTPPSNGLAHANETTPRASDPVGSLNAASSGSTAQNGRSQATLSVPSAALSAPDDDDVFVVRPRPIPMDDQSWPEVGKAHATEGERGHEREGSREGSQGPSQTRKSEKTKWVPIPAAELQAAADAQQQPRSHHARNRSQHQSHPHLRHPPSGTSSTPSASASGSQVQSRTHSAVGMHQSLSNSHAGSVSQSQVQSRSGSAHSSPPGHHNLGGRRLPDESTRTFNAVSRSISVRSSRTGSPQTFVAPLPSGEPYPGAAVAAGSGGAGTGYKALPPSLARRSSGNNADQVHAPEPHANGAPPYFVAPPHVAAPAPRAYTSGSSAHNPYAVVPPMYPQPYAGTPPAPYPPMYSYHYPYPPYVYWPHAPMSHSPAAPEGAPPPAMLTRRPQQGEGDMAAGYRDTGFVLPPPVQYERSAASQEQKPELKTEGEGEAKGAPRGRRARELSFGSISAHEVDNPDAPLQESAAVDSLNMSTVTIGEQDEEVEGASAGADKPIPPFTIGVTPGESGPARIRSRTRTQSKGRTLVRGEGVTAIAKATSELPETPAGEAEVSVVAIAATKDASEVGEAGVKVIDLTDPGEAKWEFGTTKHPEEGAETDAPQHHVQSGVDTAVAQAGSSHPSATSAIRIPPQTEVPGPTQLPPIMTTTNGLASAHPSAYPHPYPPPSSTDPISPDDWKVKDYGYGFGRRGFAPGAGGTERREWQGEREYGRPRRGSQAGYERGPHERGGYSGRRGRGLSGGYGGRGGHSRAHSRGGGSYQSRQPPFAVQPHQAPPPAEINGYYMPPPMTTYYAPFDPYSAGFSPYPPLQNTSTMPPLPVPLTPLSFPLDWTRYHLLGQLEYYLSPQNMAQDLFLRKHMDSRGWILISLLASFKRVQNLTADLQVVKDVLTLSTLAEVRNEWVRMQQWEQFVLPDAPKSTVEPESGAEAEEAEDEEEEEVVFVLGKENDPVWTAEKQG
ncbi:hypothetical protein WOLCODRAFT_139352 [Wolfiporia cocos MD-104 SS10]|uniref:HTH La-type RNA-binding domain-containing protein n=1 Tax=Wolfiporia cocos (strain MD-104) TaxID=742152 RepID=A0A2H3K468_WOLCO|nr:hypothetical protein WOLCODRAFT_139352 [Wolfiporia cocos MD-104 SS10]